MSEAMFSLAIPKSLLSVVLSLFYTVLHPTRPNMTAGWRPLDPSDAHDRLEVETREDLIKVVARRSPHLKILARFLILLTHLTDRHPLTKKISDIVYEMH